MKKIFNSLALFAFILLLTACAGKDFVRPTADTLKMGGTTPGDAVALYGEPVNQGSELKNGKNIEAYHYAYASFGSAPLFEGITPARGMNLYFADNVLVGHEFLSSFKEDHSNFDETRIADIRKGESTREQVVGMVGKPSGKYMHPKIEHLGDRADVYAYMHARGFKFYHKLLVVTYDDHGIVKDVSYETSGKFE